MSIKDDYQEYKSTLNELKMNSKPLINLLTILAEEKISNASQVVRAIEERIIETRGEAVLHVLYVLDSIVKNLRSSVYRQLFEPKLAGLFVGAFSKVDERTRLAMFKLRQTWTPFFSNQALHDLDSKTHHIDPAWPITARAPESTVSTTTNTSHDSTSSLRSIDEPGRPANRARDDNYHMIPIDRPRSDVDYSTEKFSDNEPQSKQKKNSFIRKDSFPASTTLNEEKLTTKASDDIEHKQVSFDLAPSVDNDVDNLFSGRDVDYRENDGSSQLKPSSTTNADPDSIFELNNKCFSLAEEKYKSKELSTEEFEATLKLIKAILQNEAQRLTTSTNPSSTFAPGNNYLGNNPVTNPLGSLGSNPNANPFPGQTGLLHPPNTSTPSQSLLLSGFPSETRSLAMQILTSAITAVPFQIQYNLPAYLPPIPTPQFSNLPNNYPPQNTPAQGMTSVSSASNLSAAMPSNLASGRHSPSTKRPHEMDPNETKQNGDDKKRPRQDYAGTHFDEEVISPIPSLIDANINTLKKKYIGVIQQLYVGKSQCNWCGLRFLTKQKVEYHQHLDWHFRENQYISAATSRSQLSRSWYPSLAEWTVYEESAEDKLLMQQPISKSKKSTKDEPKLLLQISTTSSSGIISCAVGRNGDLDDDRCYVCHDTFESFFDDNREEWHWKDAIRADGKIYHSICYNDSKDNTVHERNVFHFEKSDSTNSESIENSNNNQFSDSQTVETAMATAKIKSEQDESLDEKDTSSSKSTKHNDQSSISFVNLIDTIYFKKEDLKPIENLGDVSTTIKEEILESTNISEDIPFLSMKRETEY